MAAQRLSNSLDFRGPQSYGSFHCKVFADPFQKKADSRRETGMADKERKDRRPAKEENFKNFLAIKFLTDIL
jgi:hypothetical protein